MGRLFRRGFGAVSALVAIVALSSAFIFGDDPDMATQFLTAENETPTSAGSMPPTEPNVAADDATTDQSREGGGFSMTAPYPADVRGPPGAAQQTADEPIDISYLLGALLAFGSAAVSLYRDLFHPVVSNVIQAEVVADFGVSVISGVASAWLFQGFRGRR
jgi:hypothetical protein